MTSICMMAKEKRTRKSDNIQDGNGPPLEIIKFTASESATYHIKIKKNGNFAEQHQLNLFVDGTNDRWFYLAAPVQHYVESHSLAIPADARTVVTVGAAKVSKDKLESYSSRGPTTDDRIKPDITSYARVSTESTRHIFQFKFSGTSAAAPHIAGLAALLLGQNPGLDADDLESLLLSFAADKGVPGKDNLWGEGIGQLPPLDAQVNALAPTRINTPSGRRPRPSNQNQHRSRS